jgi:hypothetical protein
MEWTIRANRASVGSIPRRFVTRRGRLVQQGQGVVRAALSVVRASNEVWAHRRREQETFGAIGLGGRGLLS